MGARFSFLDRNAGGVTAPAAVEVAAPRVLQDIRANLKTADELCDAVETGHGQIRVLLGQSERLAAKLELHFSMQRGALLSTSDLDGANEFLQSCEEIKVVTEDLSQRGLLWCIINQDKIDGRINVTARKISNAFEVFYSVAQIQSDSLRREFSQAQKEDHEEFTAKLGRLSADEELTLNAIRGKNGDNTRLEDVLIGILKHIASPGLPSTPEAKFLRYAENVLRRRLSLAGLPEYVTGDWVVSSVDVDINKAELIGQGSFGRVTKAQWTGVRVAIKQMHSEDAQILSDTNRKALYREVKIWAKLRHPNIVILYGACLEATMPFLIMQYCSSGNLREFLAVNPSANRLDLCYDFVTGTRYLHQQNIIHADLKGANILVDERHVALVADFGLSLAIEKIRSTSSVATKPGMRGTIRWMAPECLDAAPVSKASDVYSLGMTIWEVFSGEVPFSGVMDSLIPRLVIDRGKRPPRPEHLPSGPIWSLVQQCWAQEPNSRPQTHEIQASLTPYTSRLGSLKDTRPHKGTLYSDAPRSSTLGELDEPSTGPAVVILDAKFLTGPKPSDVKLCSLTDPDKLELDNEHYPVLRMPGNFDCWAFSYIDNRMSYALLIYDDRGSLRKMLELRGSRYIHRITISDGVATFIGQGNTSASIPLSTLQSHISENTG